MELTLTHLIALGGIAVAVNQTVGTFRTILENKFRAGKHVSEDQGAVNLLKHRVESLEHTRDEKVPQLEQVRIDVRENTTQISMIITQVNRLVRLQDETNRSVRVIATAMGVKLGSSSVDLT